MMTRQGHWPKRGTSAAQAAYRLGFRSGLESTNAEHLSSHGEPVLFEVLKIPYVIPQTLHHYKLDFRLQNGILVETKGRFMPVDRAKHLYVRTQYPELDIRLVFSRSAALMDGSSVTTLAEWCVKHGFKYADKLIPVSWMREPGPKVGPDEVLARGPLGYQELLAMETRPKRRTKSAPP